MAMSLLFTLVGKLPEGGWSTERAQRGEGSQGFYILGCVLSDSSASFRLWYWNPFFPPITESLLDRLFNREVANILHSGAMTPEIWVSQAPSWQVTSLSLCFLFHKMWVVFATSGVRAGVIITAT